MLLLPLALLSLGVPKFMSNKRGLRRQGSPSFQVLNLYRVRSRRQTSTCCAGITASREIEPSWNEGSEDFSWNPLNLEESSRSAQESDIFDYDLLDIGSLNDAVKGGWVEAPLPPVQVVSFDLDDTLWPTGEVIGAANTALQSHLEIQYPEVLSAARRLFAKEENGGAVPTLMRQLHKARMQADPTLPKSPLNLTELRTDALVVAAQEAGLVEARQFAEECFVVWASARHRACESHLFPGVVEALWKLRGEGIVLGSITNGNADVAMIPSLKELFSFSITAEACGASKPSVIPFEAAAIAAGVPAFGPQ